MGITNIIGTFVVLILIVVIVKYEIDKNKNAKVEEDIKESGVNVTELPPDEEIF